MQKYKAMSQLLKRTLKKVKLSTSNKLININNKTIIEPFGSIRFNYVLPLKFLIKVK